MITLFTEAMSYLPSNQFAYSMLVPLPGHHLEARDALRRDYLGLAHAANPRERLAQALEVHSRCDGQRKTRKLVDRHGRAAHAKREREPHCDKQRAHREYSGSPVP